MYYTSGEVRLENSDDGYTYETSVVSVYRHEKNGADATIAVLEVPLEEASRFGIMNTNPDGSIYEFEEKPAEPKSNLASMGVYIFTWDVLRKALVEDEEDPKSNNDLGKKIVVYFLK